MGVKAVTDEDEIMMITTGGVLIQIPMDELHDLGRITSGVKLIRLDDGTKVAQIAKVRTGPIPGTEDGGEADNDVEADADPDEDQEKGGDTENVEGTDESGDGEPEE